MNEDSLEIPPLLAEDFEHGLRRAQRLRLMAGEFREGRDVSALRAFVRLSVTEFARALSVSTETVDAWEAGTRQPTGAEIAILRIAARHPKAIRDNLTAAA